MIMILGITGLAQAEDYYVLTNTNAKIYSQPDKNSSVIEYGFSQGELLKSSKIENADGKKWVYIEQMQKEKKSGWIEKVNAYRILDEKNGEWFMKLLRLEILIPVSESMFQDKYIDVNFFDYIDQQHLAIQYLIPEEPTIPITIFYKLEGNKLKKVLQINYMKNGYLVDNYIITIDDKYISIYDTKQFEVLTGSTTKEYKHVFDMSILPKGKHNLYDSYFDFDEKTRVLTKYLREDPKKPFVVTKYILKKGLFGDVKFEKK